MTRRIKWDRKVVERARDLNEYGFTAAEIRDELRSAREIEVPYRTIVDWLKYETRMRPQNNERGNVA